MKKESTNAELNIHLAFDESYQGIGLGKALLLEAVARSVRAAQDVSACLLLVHAISHAAERFYGHYGFTRLSTDTPTYAIDLLKLGNLILP